MFELYWSENQRLAEVCLNRPPANAIGLEQVHQLLRTLTEISSNSECKAVIFYAHGRFFSAGADLAWIGERIQTESMRNELIVLARKMQSVFRKIEDFHLPTFCAVSGLCLGGGFELALACDIRVAEAKASFALPEVHVGLVPGAGGTQRLAAVAGVASARRLILTGQSISGSDAYRLNIVQDLAEECCAYDLAKSIARDVIEAPQSALKAIKRCLALAPSVAGYEAELSESAELYKEPETVKRIKTFLDRSERKKLKSA